MKNIFKSLFKGIKQKEGQAKTTAATPNINCKECGMQFESEDNLRIHIKKAHSSREKRPEHQ